MAKDANSMQVSQDQAFDARAIADEPVTRGTTIQPRVVTKVCRIVTINSFVAVAMLPFSPTADWPQRLLVMGLASLVGIAGLLAYPFAERHPEGTFSTLMGFCMAVVAGTVIIDPQSAAICLVPMLLCVVAITIVSGLWVGLIAATIASLLFIVPAPFIRYPYTYFTLLLFVVFAYATVFIVDGLTRDRRRMSRNLARFYEALRASSVQNPDLVTNLEAIVASATHAVGAVSSSVVLVDEDHLVIGAPNHSDDGSFDAQVRLDLAPDGAGGPIAEAVSSGDVVVVPHIAQDDRFPTWKAVWNPMFVERGIASMAVVPLISADGEHLGALTVHGATPKAFNADDLALLKAYAEQIALVILRAQAYESERESAERLAEADQLKSEFLAMVSHELRTPLTAAKGFIDTVLLHWDRLDEERRKDLLRRSSGNANELTRLISQLLDFARIDANRVDLKPLTCNLRELVDRVTADLAPVTVDRTVAVDIDEQVKIVTDPDAFNHVLVNLITNANKFSPEGSTIHISAEQSGDEVVVSVADEGMGIAEDELERVFERFYQSERTNMTRKGTGIGLAIVKRFVEHQGGRIWVESVLGEGATFRFTVARAERIPPGVPSARPSVGAGSDDTRSGDALVS